VLFFKKKTGKTGSRLQKSKVLTNTTKYQNQKIICLSQNFSYLTQKN